MLYRGGSVWCWGDNENGQLGDGEFGSNVYSTIPVKVQDIDDAVAIGAGWEHTCAVHATGEVSCWGDDSRGELGNGETADFAALPVKVVGITDAVDVTAGHWHTCALRRAGSISCWGGDHDGQLGDGQTGDEDNMSAVPVEVSGISDAVAVSAGGEHTCALHDTGEVSCWGDNWRGELGTGEAGNEFDSGVPRQVSGISDAVDISAGDLHTCVVRESGNMSCWGSNSFGQLANDLNWPNEFSAMPLSVTNITDAVSVATGASHTCALREGGSVSCWGGNISGQLGTAPADTFFSRSPVAVEGIDDATALAAGSGHTCAVRESGGVFCWGSNYHGQLGHGQDGGANYEKVQVAGIDDAKEISATIRHTCIAHATGEVSCWGADWRGGTPSFAADAYSTLPVKIEGITDATGISADSGITCATLENNEAYCWGLYLGTEIAATDDGNASPVPIKWGDASDIARMETGGSHACALHNDGTISCAGANWYGNLGNGEFGTSVSWEPQNVAGIDDAIDISLGFAHTCAVHATGEASCWGRNDDGQLGNGADGLENNSSTPVKVQGITDAVSIASSEFSLSCVLHETGEVSCWGTNTFGELGTSDEVGGRHSSIDHISVPVKIEGITDATAVTAGNNHVCVLHETSEVSCWGSNTVGELGTGGHIADDHTATPLKVDGISGVTDISAGALHTCVISDGGSVTCWGWGQQGQLGDGHAADSSDSYTPVAVFGTITPPASDSPVDIAAGIRHTCMLYERGDIWCWGENENGQLGDGEFGTNVYSTIPVKVRGINDAVAIAAGWEHTCAVHATGEVSCWGDDSHGELGNGETADFVARPVKVVNMTDAVAVTAGHWHTCVLRRAGNVSCWGGDHDGQLGDGHIGDEFDSSVPVETIGISDAVSVSAGGEHTCAVHATGEISCWGDNWLGELGTGEAGNEFDSGVPRQVSDIADAVAVSSGDWHTCAVHATGGVSCWGDNSDDQLGSILDWPNTLSAVPLNVSGMTDVVSVSSGSSHTCALRENGGVSCWGRNASGQLGTPDIPFSAAPISVEGIDDATALAAGAGHTCAVRESGGVFCWGSNYHGQLGHGQDGGANYEKVQVAGIDDAKEISAASLHTCITHATGEVSCWGTGWKGQPDADSISPTLPVKANGITTATGVSASHGITCATLEEKEAYCWGSQLGNELITTDDGNASPVPIKSEETSDVTRVETGGIHACALHEDGTITCAGANWYGNLGNGEIGNSISWAPAQVVGIDDAVDISLGFAHSCAVHATGEASCWGRNDQGQLGNGEDGFENNSSIPVKVQGITDAISIASGEISLSCVLHATSEVSCWGTNNFGELGTAEEAGGKRSPVDHISVPVKIEGITDAAAVTAGNNHICVLHTTGEVSCWGSNAFGELGTDDHIPDDRTAAPLRVDGISGAKDIDAGGLHTCVVSDDGSVTCWGLGRLGQLGDGRARTTDNIDSYTTVRVSGT